jgi:uncharacterized membrane protein YfcA
LSIYIPLAMAAFVAGAMNAIAGGGSFLTFPALVFAGVPSVAANASSTVALFPGAIASAWAYREDFVAFEGVSFKSVLGVGLVGAVGGAILLLATPERLFDGIVPWLLLGSTLVFIFAPRFTPRFSGKLRLQPAPFLTAQFLLGLYAGYFGGALGLITLAVWSLFGLTDVKAVNPNKILLGGLVNSAAVVCFIVAGRVWWTPALLMLLAAVLGGYFGARLGRKLAPGVVRGTVTVISIAVTVAFFLRQR